MWPCEPDQPGQTPGFDFLCEILQLAAQDLLSGQLPAPEMEQVVTRVVACARNVKDVHQPPFDTSELNAALKAAQAHDWPTAILHLDHGH